MLFDFDGIVVDSNPSKLRCFLTLAELHEEISQDAILNFLEFRPHATRFEVVDEIMRQLGESDANFRLELLEKFSACSFESIKNLDVASALPSLRKLDSRNWALVSATEQRELVSLSLALEIDGYFQLGVYGSPTPKSHHITRISNNQMLPAEDLCVVGDRLSDLVAADSVGAKFIFVSQWSDARPSDLKLLREKPVVASLWHLFPGFESQE